MQKVRVAILGCGGYSGVHARRLRERDDVAIVGLCDVSDEITRSYFERNLDGYATKPEMFTSAQSMYEKTDPDAVFISTPHTLHYEHGLQALEFNCHVYMEKPMVTRAEHAYDLATRTEQTGRIFVIGYNTPCTPEFAYLREQIRNKAFGDLELVTGYLSQGWMKGTVGKWRQDPALSGGGQAYDSGAHLLNSLCWSVGAKVAEVFAFVDNHGTPVDINSVINVRFEGGTMAAITVSGNCPAQGSHMVFIFDGGRVEIDGWGGSWINVFSGKDRVKYPPITGQPQTPDDNFIDAILGKAEPRTTPRDGIIQSELMDAIYESARTGQPAKPTVR